MNYKEEICDVLKGCSGWCDPAKGIALAELVMLNTPDVCVEVGVFAGKSLLSTAIGLREVGGGLVYGVDSWATSDNTPPDESKEGVDWWAKVDLEKIYQEFQGHIHKTGLGNFIRTIRMSSQEAARNSCIPLEIDMLHIDGCHSEWSSTSDVVLWLPRLRPGGIVIMDDANWESTQTAIRFVKKFCTEMSVSHAQESVWGIYKKR
jgi:hypothetical protein